MQLTTSQHGPVTVIHLQGNLMGGPDATSLNTKLHELVEAGKKHIVIDLNGVELMNSSGLGLLIGGVSALKNAGGALKIANASAKIATLFTITKLAPLLQTYSSVETAVASFAK
jgi:anti-sigma B factor antagonist